MLDGYERRPTEERAFVDWAATKSGLCVQSQPRHKMLPTSSAALTHFSFLISHPALVCCKSPQPFQAIDPARRKSRLHFLISRVLIPTLHKPPFLTLVIPHKVVCLHQRSCSLPKHLPSVHVDRRSGRHQQSPYYVSSTELPLFPSALTTTTVF